MKLFESWWKKMIKEMKNNHRWTNEQKTESEKKRDKTNNKFTKPLLYMLKI